MSDTSPEQNAPENDASTLPDAIHCISGLIYQMLRPGTGNERPGPDDVVRVLYSARTETGQLFDSSGEDDTPKTLSVSGVIPGLAETLQLMTVGQQMHVWIPLDLSSDELWETNKGTVIFDIELVGFTRMKEPPSIPTELTSPGMKE